MSIFNNIVSSFGNFSRLNNPSTAPDIGTLQRHLLEDSFEPGDRVERTPGGISGSNTFGVLSEKEQPGTWRATVFVNGRTILLYRGKDREEAIRIRRQWNETHKEQIAKSTSSTKLKKELGVYVDKVEPIEARDGKMYKNFFPTGKKKIYCYIGPRGPSYLATVCIGSNKSKQVYRGPSLEEAIEARRRWEESAKIV